MTEQEEAEWESINGLLMTHGFKPLCLVKGADLRDFIVFDKQSSQKMRQILKTLMEETTRQQSMIRELIETNQQLKSELQLEQNRAAHQEQRANDLQQIMDSVKSKIGELEDESLNRVCQQQNRIKDLQKEYKMLQMKCQQYKKNRMEQEGTIASLQKEIHRLAKEEEERILTQNRVFAHLCRRVPHSVLDKQLLCLIDYYECKLRKLHIQRQFEEDSQSEEKDFTNLGASPNYKGVLMSLQKQLKESKSRIDVLVGEKLSLQKDLENRPTEHELRLYKQQVKKLEKTLKKNIKLQDLIGQKKSDDTEKKDEPSKDSHQQALIEQSYFQVLCSINSIVHNPRAPVIIYKQSKGRAPNGNKDIGQDCGFEHLVPIIEMWVDELTSLKDLYKSLKILSAELVPWHSLKKLDEKEGVKVGDLLFMVDTMLEEVENQKETSSTPNSQTLQAIVSHFQKLFDVQSLNGVFPRMNEVYTRLGEMNNAVRNLQELLELDSSSSLCVVVSTVGKLCEIINKDVSEQVKQVLGPEDLQSIIKKLEEHEEFFPAFQAFANDLLEILEIDDLDAIVPAVKKLKILSY
ncbi:centrosomal protein of 70 kDa isoform X2 [Mus musculus]|uniref:centrosomal protein of 70 kDa isoform 2 n=1 Tax=Mus musculus TaxID=10090 RepID=UPI0003D6F8FC|nr:centrosomal protein of 70 kDa isoform X2 [Mus musculus]XP_030100398.1 centrosomal protein of 70 kDa isoform X2 [Mus musculus]|eukprot:XP_006511453.1 PREDICTED: centrosomal protein of 70 kDa isoform X2 [Mus musculus]